MMILTGELLAVQDRPREWEGDRWNERTLHMLDGLNTHAITLARSRNGSPGFDESTLPERGSVVALEVTARAGGQKTVYYTATRALTESDIAQALGLLPTK